jgi:hypothetical protein
MFSSVFNDAGPDFLFPAGKYSILFYFVIGIAVLNG